MLNVEQVLSKSRAELLMEVAAALALQSQKPEDFPHLPAYLSATFNLPISVAVIRTVADGAVVMLSGSSLSEVPPSFEQDLLDIHAHTRPLTAQEGPTVRPTAELQKETLGNAGGISRDIVFTHSIDEQHRLLVIVHPATGETQLSTEVTEILQLVTQRLSRCLQALVMWTERPQALGQPFERLTDREWMVLRGLNSDAGEKQLADQLGLSPHTLHSHIKAIYRKVGVQGRLSLLRRLEESMREYRHGRLGTRPVQLPTEGNDRAVAFG